MTRTSYQRPVAHRADGEKHEEEPGQKEKQRAEMRRRLGLPEENLLYFLEKRAPRLRRWQRELVRIVRQIAQYFYPQRQTQADERGLRHLRATTRS